MDLTFAFDNLIISLLGLSVCDDRPYTAIAIVYFQNISILLTCENRYTRIFVRVWCHNTGFAYFEYGRRYM